MQTVCTSEKLSTLTSSPIVVNAELAVPTYYSFRRHFTSDGRYFYRFHYDGLPFFTRTDTMNGDVLTYSPGDGIINRGIKQLHYFKSTSEDYGILVFAQDRSTHIGLISICHKTQRYNIATLLRNSESPDSILCVFAEQDEETGRDQSCIVFFKIYYGEIYITKSIYFEAAIRFSRWNGRYIEGLLDGENEFSYSLMRFDLVTDNFYCITENALSFLEPEEFISDFCWYKSDLYMFVLKQCNRRAYIQKINTEDGKFKRIDFPVEEYAKINRDSRFSINTDGVICYCETSRNNNNFVDRFIRVPMRRPDMLCNYAWISTRNRFEQEQKSFKLPYTFIYQSPVRQLLDFPCSNTSIEKSTHDSGVGESTCNDDLSVVFDNTNIQEPSKFLPNFTNSFFKEN